MTREEGKKLIAERVEDFERNKVVLTKKGHGETNIRSNYIDKLFEALGWNMTNVYEVVREYSQRDRSSAAGMKKVDYALKLKGKLKLFIEAKEASVDLENNKDAIYQAKRYAYSSNGRAPIVILTDFEEFRVFNVIKAPAYDNTDRELLKNQSMRYTDYVEKWDILWDTFSREAVEGGSLDRLRGKIDKNTKTMDADFLDAITKWRETLAKNIANRNDTLNVQEINEAVQRILDRLIFIRNLEDREIEPENTLLDARKKEDIYKTALIPLFRSLDKTYNGLLFKRHFSEEIVVDDKTLKEVIREMCYPVSPFQFDIIEPEILGRVYEKFLGSKIRLTEGHRVKIEEKMEVRKAGGVYYTPEYIVEYIVANTVGKKIAGLTPDEIKAIKILDPACGSGSFLLGAYSCLLEYHRTWYAEHQQDKAYKSDWYLTSDGELKVRLDKRGDILRNNIFGVDIDHEATEVSIMSLYLKMLDDGFDKGQQDLFFAKGSILPDMSENIKCGNSLIGSDYFDGKLDIDLEELRTIKPFDWAAEGTFNKETKTWIGRGFPEIMKNGGFDCVIGNPPYVDSETMTKLFQHQREYLTRKFSTASGNWDLYIPFIEKSHALTNGKGFISLITPNKWLSIDYGFAIREYVYNYIIRLIDYSRIKVFQNANISTVVFISDRRGCGEVGITVYGRDGKSYENVLCKERNKIGNNLGVFFSEKIHLIKKMSMSKYRVKNICEVSGAFTTSEAYELIPLVHEKEATEKDILKLVNTGTIEPFHTIYGTEKTTYLKQKFNYPVVNIKEYKEKFPKRYEKFNKLKIIVSGIRHFESFLDENNEYMAGKSTSVITDIQTIMPTTLLCILNSSLVKDYLFQLYGSSGMDGGINYTPNLILSIPIPDPSKITKESQDALARLCRKISESYAEKLTAKSDGDKNQIFELISKLQKNIDDIVEYLYKEYV